MELGTEPNGIGHCLGLCLDLYAVCTVLHITIELNLIGLCLGLPSVNSPLLCWCLSFRTIMVFFDHVRLCV